MSKPSHMTEMNIWVIVSIVACTIAEISHAVGPNGLTWLSGLLLASPALMFSCLWLYLRRTWLHTLRTSEIPND